MGPTWIVVVIRKDGGVEIDEYETEEEARDLYGGIVASGEYSGAYLAAVRAEAHT